MTPDAGAGRVGLRKAATRILVFAPIGGSMLNLLPELDLPLDLNVMLELNRSMSHYYIVAHAVGLFWLLFGWTEYARSVRVLAACCSLVLLASYLPPLIPFYRRSPAAPFAEKVSFGLYYANVYSRNERYTDILRQVEALKPDVIVLGEMTDTWIEALKLAQRYSFRIEAPRPFGGIAVYSDIPLARERRRFFPPLLRPLIMAELRPPGAPPFTLAVLHAYPPRNRELLHERDVFLRQAGAFLGSLGDPLLLVGDLNATPFSPVYARFVERARLANVQEGRGLSYTWRNFVFPLLYAAIDHILYRGPLRPDEMRRMPDVGSDHLPLYVRFSIRRSAEHADRGVNQGEGRKPEGDELEKGLDEGLIGEAPALGEAGE